jgi:hypothetical protein
MATEEDQKETVTTTITLMRYQREWLNKKKSFNLSGFVQEQLDKLIENDGNNRTS